MASGLQPPPPSPARGPPPLLPGIRAGSIARLLARLEGRGAADATPSSPTKPSQNPVSGTRAAPHSSPGAAEPGAAEAGGRGWPLRRRWYGDAETQRIMRILRTEPPERGR